MEANILRCGGIKKLPPISRRPPGMELGYRRPPRKLLSSVVEARVQTEEKMVAATEKTTYKDNWFDRLAIRYLSRSIQATTGSSWKVRKSEVKGKTEKNVVYIPKCRPCEILLLPCRFLESTNCVGMCTNLCKVPSQQFIQDSLGMPVYMAPSMNLTLITLRQPFKVAFHIDQMMVFPRILVFTMGGRTSITKKTHRVNCSSG
ncbi:hypothetical protein BHM03_00032564 [Ensete ventricosum]|nr:hypothetical protein BHM03_00032564 [Ensete ventricosum]